LYGPDNIVYTDCRDIVSFTAKDGRPLILIDSGNPAGKLLAVGKPSEPPARFYREDWGWGAFTFTDTESGLLLETPFLRQEQDASAEYAQNIVAAGAQSSLNWFVTTLFNTLPQEGGGCLLRTWDNRRIAAPEAAGPVLLRHDPLSGTDELFTIKLERDGLAAAAENAAQAGQIIFIAGNNPMINGREEVDRPSLNLPPRQEELIRRVCAVNPKIALVLLSGYPFTCRDIAAQVPALVWMAHGIQETGNGLADILGGACSPAGRLPLTWYEDEKQLPPMMEYDIISAGSTYQYFPGKTLFPFGHGLSYSSFAYSHLVIDKSAAAENETVNVSFTLKNTGSLAAEEVPQMYAAFSVSASCKPNVRRPLKSLKGFTRLSLKPGEEQIVRFALPVRELAIWESFHGRFCVEPGHCAVLIGASSADIRLSGGFEVKGEIPPPRNIASAIYAERFDDYHNCFLHEKRGSAIPAVFNTEDGGWIRFAALDFASDTAGVAGTSRCSAIVQGAPGSRVEMRLDAPDGVLLAAIEVPNTGDFSSYPLERHSPRRRPVWACAEAFTVPATEKICGVHDLYLALYGKTGIWRFALT
jgi:beta-glucosidase